MTDTGRMIVPSVAMTPTGSTVLARTRRNVGFHEDPFARRWIWATALGALPVVLVLLSTRGHIGISYDSVMYASASRYYQDTGSLDFPTIQPPLLQALIVLFGTGKIMLAVNCLALWVTGGCTYLLGLQVSGSRSVATVSALWFGLSLGTVQIHTMLWSEPIFCAAISVSLLALIRIGQDGLTLAQAAALIASVNVAGLTRYIGLALIVLVAVVLLRRGLERRSVLRHLLVAAACGSGLASLLLWHTLTRQGLTGPRYASKFTPVEVALQLPDGIMGFLLNEQRVLPAAIATLILLALAGMVGAAWPGIPHPQAASVLAGWVAAYSLALLFFSSTSNVNAIDFRLVLPAAGGLIVLMSTAGHLLFPRRVAVTVASHLPGDPYLDNRCLDSQRTDQPNRVPSSDTARTRAAWRSAAIRARTSSRRHE